MWLLFTVTRIPGAFAGYPTNMWERRLTGNQKLYDRWINELWAGRPIAAELVCPDFVGHWPTRDVRGPDELQAVVDTTRRTLADLLFVVEIGPFMDGDMMAARWIGTGADAHGPTRLTGNDILRVDDGKFVEYWSGTSRG